MSMWICKNVKWKCKNYRKCEKDYSWNPSTCIWGNSKYLKSIDDASVIMCDEITSVMDIVTTKMANIIATNVTNISSINCHSKKKKEVAVFWTQFY